MFQIIVFHGDNFVKDHKVPGLPANFAEATFLIGRYLVGEFTHIRASE